MEKKFTFKQISTKIDDLYEYLSERELKLGNEYKSVDDLFDMYEEVEELNRKIGRLKGSFNKAVVGVITERQKDIMFEYMTTCTDPKQLLEFTNRVQTLNNVLKHRADEDTILSLNSVEDSTPQSRPNSSPDVRPKPVQKPAQPSAPRPAQQPAQRPTQPSAQRPVQPSQQRPVQQPDRRQPDGQPRRPQPTSRPNPDQR